MDALLERSCPCCGGVETEPEMRSNPAGEDVGLEGLVPFWEGLRKERMFFTYSRCRTCDLLYCPRYFTGEQLGELYANLAPNMDMVPSAAIAATQRGYWSAVAKDVTVGDYLEVGPDVGHIVSPAAASGKFGYAWLFEPNRAVHDALARSAGALPHTISASMDDFGSVPDGTISLAVMIHVLDHIIEPLENLRQICRKLKPGGQLLIVTHNEKSLLRTVMGRTFPPFCLQHPELYNPDTMTTMLTTAGFSSVRVQRSVNHFPISFVVRQAGQVVGLNLSRLPLTDMSVGLKLGNMLTTAKAKTHLSGESQP